MSCQMILVIYCNFIQTILNKNVYCQASAITSITVYVITTDFQLFAQLSYHKRFEVIQAVFYGTPLDIELYSIFDIKMMIKKKKLVKITELKNY